MSVDNILDMAYLKRLFPALVEADAGYEFFYEVKANLSREQLKLLAQAGVTRVQPGLESLSSHVLDSHAQGRPRRPERKPAALGTVLQHPSRVEPTLGFPRRDRDRLRRTSGRHSTSVSRTTTIGHRPDRTRAIQSTLHRVQYEPNPRESPERSYRYVYPQDIDLTRVAYFFDYELKDGMPDSAYSNVRREIAAWSKRWMADKPPLLTYWSAPHFVQIHDQRHPEHAGTYTFEGTLADLYLACINRPTTAAAVRRQLDLRLPVEGVQEVFTEFRQRGLMFLDDHWRSHSRCQPSRCGEGAYAGDENESAWSPASRAP